MEIQQRSTAGQGLGIAGLILGIIAFLIAFIPCVGLLALIPGIIAIVLSVIGLSQANRGDGTKGVIIAALVISIIATSVAGIWGFFFATGATILNKVGWEVKKELEEEFGDDYGKKFEEAFEDFGKDLEETLEDLEIDEIDIDNLDSKELSDEDFDKLLKAYESLIKDYLQIAKEVENGKISALANGAKVAVKATAISAKLVTVSDNLTEEQQKKFDELNEKYEEAFKQIEESKK